jgi:septal ring factor EnvC (AmiA/AmiB activator)
MKATFTTGWIIFLCFALTHFPAEFCLADAPVKKASKKKQIQRIESRLTEEGRKLNTFQSKEKRLLTLVAELKTQVSNIKKEMETLALNIRDIRGRVDVQKEKLKELKSILKRTELKISEYLIALYKYSRRGNPGILANADALSGLRRSIKYIGIVTEKDRLELRRLTEQASEYHDEIIKTEASIGVMEREVEGKGPRLAFLKTSVEKKVLLLMKIHEEKEFYETSVEELETAVADLKQALNPAGNENPYEIDPSLHFEDCKGRLPLPIRGKIVRNRAKIRPALSSAKGVVIQSDNDSAVRAVFKGEVAYSGRLKGYGEVVILSHGDRFFTVSAHLKKRGKAKGDQVRGGEILGWVEENGSSMGASVYFEVRKADRKLDPQVWLKID